METPFAFHVTVDDSVKPLDNGVHEMTKEIRITDNTNAIIIWGKVHVFHYTNKPTDCKQCSLKGYCDNYDVFGKVCDRFKKNLDTYKGGIFKEYKEK